MSRVALHRGESYGPEQLRARFQALPHDTGRVQEHIRAGHVRLGNFLQTYDTLVHSRKLSRPAGRERLGRGDGDTYTTSGGDQCCWEVGAVIEDEAVIAVTVFARHDRREYSVLWNHKEQRVGDYPSGFEAPAKELFDSLGPSGVWEPEKHKLDLWNWVSERRFVTPCGISAVVRPGDDPGEWYVELAGGTFSWQPVDGINVVRGIAGFYPPDALLAKLFVKIPLPLLAAPKDFVTSDAALEPFQGGAFTHAEFRRYWGQLLPLSEIPCCVPLSGWQSAIAPRQRPCGPCEELLASQEKNEAAVSKQELRTFRYAAHRSQIKLCVELEAIVRALDRYPGLKYVLYAGAAPGDHIAFLAEALPRLEFHLVDPTESRVTDHYQDFPGVEARIHITRALFTVELADQWRERASETFFISDVHTGGHDQESGREIRGAMQAQRDWWERAHFAASLLRFRIDEGARTPYEYLAGGILLQPFGPDTAAEGRLFVWGDAGRQSYDCQGYTKYYYWLNTVIREWASFDNGVNPSLVPGLCRCFDCSRMIHIFRAYVTQNPVAIGMFDGWAGYVAYLVGRMVTATGQRLYAPPHGLQPGALPYEKRLQLANQYGQVYDRRRPKKVVPPQVRRAVPTGDPPSVALRPQQRPQPRTLPKSGTKRDLGSVLPSRLVEVLDRIRLPPAESFDKK
jgi:hypothetical protein